MAPTVASALKVAANLLSPSDCARLDAEILLADVLAVSRTQLVMDAHSELSQAHHARYETLIAARQSGMPVAYLTNSTEFWSLPLLITSDVLVPRPETELLVECALAITGVASTPSVIDLGTGSGAIAAAFASERKLASVFACERSQSAARVAQANFQRLGLQRIGLIVGDWLNSVAADTLDLVLANPPYIGDAEKPMLERDVLHEPSAALFAGQGGLADLTLVVRQAVSRLRPGGHTLVEHGYQQGAAVRELFLRSGYTAIETWRDLSNHERVTGGRRLS